MASTTTSERSTHDVQGLSPSSSTSIQKRSSIERAAQANQTVKRSSSTCPVQTMPSLSSCPPAQQTERLLNHTDEITPMRRAASHTDRTYDTHAETATGSAPKIGTTKHVSSESANHAGDEARAKGPWYKRMVDKYGSVSLDNKGSVARDHLALERTFLAWLRTSLAFASIGIAITQLFRLNASAQAQVERVHLTSGDTLPTQLPLSPLLGHGLAPEFIPLLQQLIVFASASSLVASPVPSPYTLWDQFLLSSSQPLALSSVSEAASRRRQDHPVTQQQFDEAAAARLRHVGKPLGATFIGISIIVLFIGFHRYFEAQFWIIRGKFPASRGSVAITGLIAGALIVASLVVILVVAPTSYQT